MKLVYEIERNFFIVTLLVVISGPVILFLVFNGQIELPDESVGVCIGLVLAPVLYLVALVGLAQGPVTVYRSKNYQSFFVIYAGFLRRGWYEFPEDEVTVVIMPPLIDLEYSAQLVLPTGDGFGVARSYKRDVVMRHLEALELDDLISYPSHPFDEYEE